ncbi:MAG TPA: ATP-binding cassette domain-containing protein, partial [Aliiroseovarius sp.]|nr:ATP-binding cassette domain-containing protein [Aliiroseovarius sp.]
TPVMLRRSVLDNLIYPLRLHGVDKAAARDKAALWLAKVGLAGMGAHPARGLSGGERQKLALARALVREPELLLLDEPCANLDGAATHAIEEILRTARAEGTRIVMTTHDLGQARRLADEVLFILGGKIHESGPAEPFFASPGTEAARAFLKGDIIR